jgi:hypothetical protein
VVLVEPSAQHTAGEGRAAASSMRVLLKEGPVSAVTASPTVPHGIRGSVGVVGHEPGTGATLQHVLDEEGPDARGQLRFRQAGRRGQQHQAVRRCLPHKLYHRRPSHEIQPGQWTVMLIVDVYRKCRTSARPRPDCAGPGVVRRTLWPMGRRCQYSPLASAEAVPEMPAIIANTSHF